MLVKKIYGSWDDVDDYWVNNNLIDCSKIKKLKKNNLQYNFNNNNVLRKRFINGQKYINGKQFTNREFTNNRESTNNRETTNREQFINTRNEKFTIINESSSNKKNIYR